jgi:uncharacterized delta-60 repeat protein
MGLALAVAVCAISLPTRALMPEATADYTLQPDLARLELEPLFLDPPEALKSQARPAEAHTARSRVVQLNPRLLESGRGTLQQRGTRLMANLFEDQAATLLVDRVEVKGPGEFVCFGHLEGRLESCVILASVDGAMAGTFTLAGEAPYQVQFISDGLHRVNQVTPLPAGWCGTHNSPGRGILPRQTKTEDNQPQPAFRGPAATPPAFHPNSSGPGTNAAAVVIDVLVAYTPKALAGAGSEAGIRALMDFAVAEANFCYANSQINVRWNIVYEGLANCTESGDICTDAYWVEQNLSSLRSTYRADVAIMFSEFDNTGFSGCAQTWGAAFVRSRVTTAGYLVVHEVSHLLGAGHDRLTCQNQPGNCGAYFPYSYGYRFVADGVTYITVMAYEPGIIIPHFSNPNVFFHGVPTGVPANQTNSADNALTINRYATNVANWMSAKCRFEFVTNYYTVPETAGTLALEVMRTGDTNAAATVQCIATSGTAKAGVDFDYPATTLTFAPGQVRQTTTVTVLNDGLPEGDETFVLNLRNPQPGTALGLPSSATVVIQEDEVTYHFTTDRMVVLEGAGRVEVPVRREGDANAAGSVAYVITNGTAQAGVNFQAQAGTLNFAPSDWEQSIPVDILDDGLVESDQTFTLTLQQPDVGGISTPGTLVVTIADQERPGSLDLQFNASSGPDDWVYGLTADPDGGVLCMGRFTKVNGQPRTALVRFLPDGSVDPAFHPVQMTLSVVPDASLYPADAAGALRQSNGQLLVWGEFASVNGVLQTHLTRLNSNGIPDAAFVLNPGPNGAPYYGSGLGSHDLALQPDGRIIIGGDFTTVNGISRRMLARLMPDGSVDSTFQASINVDSVYVAAVAVQADGRVLVGGNLTGFENLAKPYFSRLNGDGKLDRTFRGTADGVVLKIQALADGRILVAGFFSTPRRNLARLNPDGSTDQSFIPRPALNGQVFDFQVLPDGRIMIVGSFTSVGSSNRNGIARLNPDGSLDPTFDAGLGANDIVRSVAVQPNGWVVIGGEFTSINGQPCKYLARLRSDGTRPVFASPGLLSAGEVHMKLFGNAGSSYVVESSSDLAAWVPVWTNRFTASSWEWTERASPEPGSRFYRAYQLKP